jgi:hypothetical protein
MADEHKPRQPVPAQLPRLQHVCRFPDEYKGHMAVPPRHVRSTWPLCSSVNKHKELKKNSLFSLPPRLGSLQNRYKQTYIQYITIQQVSNMSNTTATHQYSNITSHRMHCSSLHREPPDVGPHSGGHVGGCPPPRDLPYGIVVDVWAL